MDSNDPKRKWKLTLAELLIIVAIVATLAGLLFPISTINPMRAKRKLTRMDMTTLAEALNQHRAKYGAYPPGGFAATLEPLMGSNSHQTNSLERIFRNDRGELIDYWLTPYRVETNATNGLSIRSAGPDRRFGTEDDLEQSL